MFTISFLLASLFPWICIAKNMFSGNGTFKLVLLKDFGPKTLTKLRWVHFPRAGMTFGVTVLRYSCEALRNQTKFNLLTQDNRNKPWMSDPTCKNRILLAPSEWLMYSPLRFEDSGFIVGMFRNPKDRLASQLRWMRSMDSLITHYGVADEDVKGVLRLLNEPASVLGAVNDSHPCFKAKTDVALRTCRYLAVTYLPGIKGCMTKMVLGRACAERYTLTTTDLLEAQKIVRDDFAFVGIAEEWDESVRLFHGLHGGALYSDELFSDYRKLPVPLEPIRRAIANSYDYFDEELYRTAVEVFHRQRADLRERVRLSGKSLL